jgi:hypothetical protein
VKPAVYSTAVQPLDSFVKENDRLRSRLNAPSAAARLAIALFTTGLGLLVIGFFAQ